MTKSRLAVEVASRLQFRGSLGWAIARTLALLGLSDRPVEVIRTGLRGWGCGFGAKGQSDGHGRLWQHTASAGAPGAEGGKRAGGSVDGRAGGIQRDRLEEAQEEEGDTEAPATAKPPPPQPGPKLPGPPDVAALKTIAESVQDLAQRPGAARLQVVHRQLTAALGHAVPAPDWQHVQNELRKLQSKLLQRTCRLASRCTAMLFGLKCRTAERLLVQALDPNEIIDTELIARGLPISREYQRTALAIALQNLRDAAEDAVDSRRDELQATVSAAVPDLQTGEREHVLRQLQQRTAVMARCQPVVEAMSHGKIPGEKSCRALMSVPGMDMGSLRGPLARRLKAMFRCGDAREVQGSGGSPRAHPVQPRGTRGRGVVLPVPDAEVEYEGGAHNEDRVACVLERALGAATEVTKTVLVQTCRLTSEQSARLVRKMTPAQIAGVGETAAVDGAVVKSIALSLGLDIDFAAMEERLHAAYSFLAKAKLQDLYPLDAEEAEAVVNSLSRDQTEKLTLAPLREIPDIPELDALIERAQGRGSREGTRDAELRAKDAEIWALSTENRALNEALQQNEKALEQKEKALEQRAKALEQEAKALEQKAKALEQKAKALEVQQKAVDKRQKVVEQKEKAVGDSQKALEENDIISGFWQKFLDGYQF